MIYSKKQFAYQTDTGFVVVIGTPSDIRKRIRALEREEYYSIYPEKPIFREGRKYVVYFWPLELREHPYLYYVWRVTDAEYKRLRRKWYRTYMRPGKPMKKRRKTVENP